jgi:cholest-4-en-3-one 26-monooxygenase
VPIDSQTAALEVDLTDLTNWNDGPPHAVFDALREEAPVHWQAADRGTRTGGFWSLTGFDDIAAVSRDKENFTVTLGPSYPLIEKAPFNDAMMMFLDPPEHTRLRRKVQAGFTPRVIAQFDSWVRDIVVGVLDDVEVLDTFDFVAQVASYIPAFVIADVCGVPRERRLDIVTWANSLFSANLDTSEPQGVAKAAGAMLEYAMELREAKRSAPAEDLISELVNSSEELTDAEYQGFFVLFLGAGFETTHTMMSQGMRAIIEDESVARQVSSRCSDGNSALAVEEILRYVSPVNQMARIAKQDLVLRDQTIAEGEMVVMWYAAGNRDPSVFEHPHLFDTGRPSNPHIAFGGGGAHFCLGAHLARLEGRILFEEIERRTMRVTLAGEPQQVADSFVNRLAKLPVARV